MYVKDNALRAFAGVINDVVNVLTPVTIRDSGSASVPEYVPDPIPQIFQEGTSSVAASCFNAAGAMFRLCLDIATKGMLPVEGEAGHTQPSRQQRENLASRLDWLFEQEKIPRDLSGLARCVRQTGNEGAHDGTLTDVDAGDLEDFTTAFLERIYTEPGRIEAAEKRREERRQNRQ